jgi:hypothetical protein
VHNELKFSKVSASWTPRLLPPEHKKKCLVVVTQLVQRYDKEGDEFLNPTVTYDETRVHYYTSESKKESMQWKHTNSPLQEKQKHLFHQERLWLGFSGIQSESFTWTF